MGTNRLLRVTIFVMLLLAPPVLNASSLKDCVSRSNMDALLAQLPQPKRRILDETLKRAEKQNNLLRERKRGLEAELEGLLTAETFDRATYLDKSARLGTLRAKMNANLDDAIAEVAAQFSQEERHVLMKMRQLWHTHGYHAEWSVDDEKDTHPPAAE